jgi:hypothetical protein
MTDNDQERPNEERKSIWDRLRLFLLPIIELLKAVNAFIQQTKKLYRNVRNFIREVKNPGTCEFKIVLSASATLVLGAAAAGGGVTLAWTFSNGADPGNGSSTPTPTALASSITPVPPPPTTPPLTLPPPTTPPPTSPPTPAPLVCRQIGGPAELADPEFLFAEELLPSAEDEDGDTFINEDPPDDIDNDVDTLVDEDPERVYFFEFEDFVLRLMSDAGHIEVFPESIPADPELSALTHFAPAEDGLIVNLSPGRSGVGFDLWAFGSVKASLLAFDADFELVGEAIASVPGESPFPFFLGLTCDEPFESFLLIYSDGEVPEQFSDVYVSGE